MPARKKAPKKTSMQYKTNDPAEREKKTDYGVTFVNIQLLADDKARLRELSEQAFDFGQAIADWVLNGYKFSIGEDKNGTAFTASITGKTCIEENIGYCLSAKHGELELAILCLWYKHHHLCADGVFPSKEEMRRASGDFE